MRMLIIMYTQQNISNEILIRHCFKCEPKDPQCHGNLSYTHQRLENHFNIGCCPVCSNWLQVCDNDKSAESANILLLSLGFGLSWACKPYAPGRNGKMYLLTWIDVISFNVAVRYWNVTFMCFLFADIWKDSPLHIRSPATRRRCWHSCRQLLPTKH